MKNAYIHAVALEAMNNDNCNDALLVQFAVAVGYYYTDDIERYLTAWNCHELVRTLDEARAEAQEEAIEWSYKMGEETDLEYINDMSQTFEDLGRKFNLLDEFRENAIC